MVYGLDIPGPGWASAVSKAAFESGLVIETAGADDEVVKFLPPLVIEEDVLREGLEIVDRSLAALVANREQVIRGEAEPGSTGED